MNKLPSYSNIIFLIAGSLLVTIINLFFAYTGCNDAFGKGIYTSDGECYDILFGYNPIGFIIEIVASIAICFISLKIVGTSGRHMLFGIVLMIIASKILFEVIGYFFF